MRNGIININKPKGITSHDVVYAVRRKLGMKKVGHTGTLDPMATGVLPICFGKATRIIQYLDYDMKTYICEMQLGLRTDTLDVTGETLSEESYEGVTKEDVKAAFKEFDGEIDQVPPKYSALKVDGKRLYQYARAGQEVEIKSRKTYIEHLKVMNIDLNEGLITFEVKCSKGTYIRSICEDAGETLGCGATMSGLVRTESGCFNIKQAIDLEDLKILSEEGLDDIILSVDYPLVNLGKMTLDEHSAWKFLNGQRIAKRNVSEVNEGLIPGKYAVYSSDKFLGVAIYEDENYCYKAEKVIGGKDENI